MGRRKPTTTLPADRQVYRPLFRDSFRVAWERKSLWVFGLFAALLSTGGVCEMAAKNYRHLSTMSGMYADLMHGTFTGTQTFGRMVRGMMDLDPSRVSGVVTIAMIFGVLAIVVSVSSQGALISGVGARALPPEHAAEYGRRAFWHMLALNALNKIAHAVLTVLTALPLFLLVAEPEAPNALLVFLALLVAFPLTIAIASVFMLASVNVVRSRSHALDAIHHAVVIFREHWLAAFETGLLLFVSVSLAAIAFVLAVGVAAIPFAVVVSMSLMFGSAFLFLAVNVLGAALFVLFLLLFVGATTAFQYAVWVRFYDHAAVGRKTLSKSHRMWRGE